MIILCSRKGTVRRYHHMAILQYGIIKQRREGNVGRGEGQGGLPKEFALRFSMSPLPVGLPGIDRCGRARQQFVSHQRSGLSRAWPERR
jgi:hypothetical protein